MNKTRFAFAGFRHSHIGSLLAVAQNHPSVEIVATCEEDPAHSLLGAIKVESTHHDFEKMLAEVEFDVLAIGDYYAKHGPLAIRALETGHHVIADKPLCIDLAELARIQELAREKNLKVGLMLDLRDHPNFRTLREFLQTGALGEVTTIHLGGQHSLMWGTRPGWYFEPGKHGGTLNDIAIHAVDLVPWLTGHDFKKIVGARSWNGKAKEAPQFEDCAQFMMELGNGAGITGDVSYLAPDGCVSGLSWRVLVHGTKGFAETGYSFDGVRYGTDGVQEVRLLNAGEGAPGQYLNDFLADIAGEPICDGLTTESVLRASRWALELQAAS